MLRFLIHLHLVDLHLRTIPKNNYGLLSPFLTKFGFRRELMKNPIWAIFDKITVNMKKGVKYFFESGLSKKLFSQK